MFSFGGRYGDSLEKISAMIQLHDCVCLPCTLGDRPRRNPFDLSLILFTHGIVSVVNFTND